MNVDKMKAGREMDALVAERVIDEVEPIYAYPDPGIFGGQWSVKGAWIWESIYDEGDIPAWYPKPYSTDIAAAFEVDKPGWRWTFAEHPLRLTVLLWHRDRHTVVEANSTITIDRGPIATAHVKWDEVGTKSEAYALGRCRAALKATEKE